MFELFGFENRVKLISFFLRENKNHSVLTASRDFRADGFFDCNFKDRSLQAACNSNANLYLKHFL
jgi:hypothetical protein